MAGKSKNAKLRARLRSLESQAVSRVVTQSFPPGKKKRNKNKNKTKGGMGRAMNGVPSVARSSGSDMLAALKVTPSSVGSVLWTRPLSPIFLQNTRLAAEATLWGRWRPISLEIDIQFSSALTTFGLVGLGWTTDPTLSFPAASSNNVQRVAAMVPSMFVPINKQATIRIPCDTARKWYETDNKDQPESSHGTASIVVAGDIGGFTGSIGLTIMMRWQVEFEGRLLPFEQSGGGGDVIHPDAEWRGDKLFTTSDTSFSSAILTIKAHEGGGAVTYSSAQAGVVYKKKTGALKYINQATQAVDVTYASMARGYGQPILVLHSTHADALAYQTSGDTSKCLQYYGAGPWGSSDVTFETATAVEAALRARVEHLERQLQNLLVRSSASQAVGPSSVCDGSTTPFSVVDSGEE